MSLSYIHDAIHQVAQEADAANLGLDPTLAPYYALLGLTRGPLVTDRDVHDAWGIHTVAVRRVHDHGSLVPFRELPPEVQVLDAPYRQMIGRAFPRSASLRRFVLQRDEDPTEVSGTGVVAEGVEFTDGTVALRWRTGHSSTVFWASIHDAVAVHGHDGLTRVVWQDDALGAAA